MVKWKLEQNVGEAEQEQPAESEIVVVDVQADGCYPKYNNHYRPGFGNLMPTDHRSFRKPVEIVVSVSKSDKAHGLSPGIGKENIVMIRKLAQI